MAIDIICAGCILLLCLIGFLTGFLTQVLRIVSFFVAYFFAHLVSHYSAQYIAREVNLSYNIAFLLSIAILWIFFYIMLSVLSLVLVASLREGRKNLSRLDRRLGALLGGIKGLLLIYVVLCGLVLIEKPLYQVYPSIPFNTRASALARIVKDNNILTYFHSPYLSALIKLAKIIQDPGRPQKLKTDPRTMKLLANPRAAFLLEPEMLQAVIDRD
jgi:membrane protein required for colicin V production